MEMVKDIILDDLGDLSFENGDFKVAESDQQHCILLINTFAGNWKQSPLCGVGIIQYLASAGQGAALKRSINIQLKADGYTKIDVVLKENSSGKFEYYLTAERP
jgi:hypothetical protein